MILRGGPERACKTAARVLDNVWSEKGNQL
jgi:hypothetical protein